MTHLERAGIPSSSTPKIEVYSSTFKNIQARLSGGAFYIDNTFLSEMTITTQTSFTNIKALSGNGGIFNIKRLNAKLTLSHSTFQDFNVPND